jgi:two-component system, LuxR family, response regulator FixJ
MSGRETCLVHVVDDDEAIRRSVSFALKTSGFQVRVYGNGAELLRGAPDLEAGCILLDIRMPGMDGLEVQEALQSKGVTLPVIIMTGHGDVSLAVRAMKAGAIDFIEKPFEKAVLLAALQHAMNRIEQSAATLKDASEAATKLRLLTSRERDVLNGLAKGLPNKSIAYDLGISPRTVEIHRANLMAKLGVKSLSEALRIAFAAEANQSAT